jgi:triphosphoribosyl-dephospho-CoA synthase
VKKLLKANNYKQFAEEISNAAQLALLLEVSGYPKPGNVHRLRDFEDTRFEHFLASAIATGDTIQKAAERGIQAGRGKIQVSEIGVGRYIAKCVQESNKWHRGGNTWLGAIMLIIPLAISAGLSGTRQGALKLKPFRLTVKKVIEATTSSDTVHLYNAIRYSRAGGLGKIDRSLAPDISNPNCLAEIKAKGLKLSEVMRICSKWDTICREWITGFKLTFEVGYPSLMTIYKKTGDINIATAHTFLTILSTIPDSLVARKSGIKIAEEITTDAKVALEKGGLLTMEGKRAVKQMDLKMGKYGNKRNPGTTADLTASSIMVAVMCGLRP